MLCRTALTALAASQGVAATVHSWPPSVRIRPRMMSAIAEMGCAAGIDDERFMREALVQAEMAFARCEVPVGAVIVRNGSVIAAAHNRVEELRDASAHAELLCAREAAASGSSWRLEAATLYCTTEPCPMCLAALHAFRIERLVYGTTNPRLGAVESALRPPANPYHTLKVTGGVLAEPAAKLMRDFFVARREGLHSPGATGDNSE